MIRPIKAKEALETANTLSLRNQLRQMGVCYEAIHNAAMNGITNVSVDLDPNFFDHCHKELLSQEYAVEQTKNGLKIDWSK